MADEPTQELAKNVGSYGGGIVAVLWTVEKLWARLTKKEAQDDDETRARLENAERKLETQREAERNETRRLMTAIETSMSGFASALGEVRADIRALSGLPAEVAKLGTEQAGLKERMNAALAAHAGNIDDLKERLRAVETENSIRSERKGR